MTLCTVLAGMLLAWQPRAFALDPALDVSQYAHTAWTIRAGFSKGTIVAIAQTQDGYLWLGTEFGLLRFDGVRYVPWQPPTGERLPSSYIRSLLAARDGRLWIGTSEGLSSWQGGKLTTYQALARQSVFTLLEDHEGTVWAGGHAAPSGGLCAIHSEKVQCFGEDGSFGQYVDSLYEDRGGNLWVASLTGLWRWKPGPPKLYPMPDRVQALMDGDNGALVIVMHSGIRQFVGGKLDANPLPASGQRFTASEILRDRDGGLWIGTTDRGLVHVHQGRADVFERPDGLSSDFIERLFEDREGDIWVATLDGLDRFRELAVPTISVKQGLSNAIVKSVLAARDGSVWLGTADGLNRWNNGRLTVYRKRSPKAITGSAREQELRGLNVASELGSQNGVREITGSGLPDDTIESLFQDFRDQIWVSTRRGVAFLKNGRFIPVNSVPGEVHSIAGDRAGNIWVSQDQSLFHVNDGRVVERIPWAQFGRQDPARALVADPLLGGLWLGFRDGGVVFFKGGQVRASYTPADGLAEGHIRDLRLDRGGTLWVSTEGGLSRLKDGRFATISSKNGLPCDAVHWVMEDDDQSFWLYMGCGLVRLSRSQLDAWAISANKDPERRIQATVFDSSDGVRSHTTSTGYSPSVAKSPDGKLWFLPWDGVSVLDPHHLPFNRLPAPVQISQITADRQTYDAVSSVKGSLRLPPLLRDLEIDYTALSFVAPEKVLFRYKLEGFDGDWQEAGNRRQAFYSNLSPRNYRFRVSACNNSGVWNEASTFLDFDIAPAYYQTAWFRASSVAAFLALLWALHRLRLRQIAQKFNTQLEARVGERTRIARELHDTLLQSFHGLIFRFQAVDNLLPARPGEAKQTLESALDDAAQAITEARDAVHELRSSTVATNDLAAAVKALGDELAVHHTTAAEGHDSAAFIVEVEGTPQDLNPIPRDEIYRIAGEAMRNSFRHARARRVEVEIHYDEQQLQVRIRDDGIGIDKSVLSHQGRVGHWGLSGMRERAKQIGAELDVWSELGAGTEVELRMPASIAYQTYAGGSFRLFRKMTGTGS